MRAGVFAAVLVDVAERPHLGDGRRPGGDGAGHGRAQTRPGPWGRGGEAFQAPIREQYERQGNPYYATARLWDDGVIDPADTRRVLGLALSVCAQAPLGPVPYGVFRM